jgi:succinate-semialdehyde dehydrogenase/glutarate-semialdehyde dehydrogenase
MKAYPMFIGGQWVDAASGATFDDLNLYTREVYTRVAEGDTKDADRAMAVAYAAWKQWAATSPGERARKLSKDSEILEANRKELADVLIEEEKFPLYLEEMEFRHNNYLS